MTNPDNVGGLPVFVSSDIERLLSDAYACGMNGDPFDMLNARRVIDKSVHAYAELCRAATAGGDAERDAMATQLRELICEYWDLAYDEGVDKRNNDTPAGDANRVANEIETIIRALSRGGSGHAGVSAPAGSGEVSDEMVKAARGKLPADIEDSFAGAEYAEGFNGAMALVREELASALEAALLRKLQQGADKPLTADMTKALPGGIIDDTTFDQIEHALDRAGAPACDESGKWLTLPQRIAALASQGQEGK